MTNLYILIAANGLFKIGKSDDLRNRIRQIKAASPVECELFWTITYDDNVQDLENKLHEKFSSRQVRGEWFALTKNDLLVLTTGDSDYQDLIEEMASWGFFMLGEKELSEKVVLASLWRIQALCDSKNLLKNQEISVNDQG